MKFQVAKQDLERALKSVGSSISGSPADLSGHFLFRCIPNVTDKFEIRTYSGRLYSGAPCVATVDGDTASFTVEGKRLRAILGVIDDCALDFDLDKTVVTVAVPGMGKQTFQSLDPDQFPHWDDTLLKAKVTGKMPVERLIGALSYARPFISVEETKAPQMCVCEVRQGVMCASSFTHGAGVYLTLPLLTESNLRVQVKDLGSILAFLNGIEGEVEIRETEKYIFLLAGDGSVFGWGKYLSEFPKTKNPPEVDPHWWKLDVAKALKALPFLKAGADEENNRVRLVRTDENGPVQFQMLSKTGKMTSVEVPILESGSQPDAPALPVTGFGLGYDPFLKVLELHREDEAITLGITARGNAGYVRIAESKFGEGDEADKYVTIIVWLQ